MRIHIIGVSGSGKRHLANKPSHLLQIEHYDLDQLFWQNTESGYGKKRDICERDYMLTTIVEKDDWIIEGVYYAWFSTSFSKADYILVPNVPSYVYKYRLLKRFVKRKLNIEKGKKETFSSCYALWKWTKYFENDNMPPIKRLLNAYQYVIYLHNHAEINEILTKIGKK